MKKFLITLAICCAASVCTHGATVYDWKTDWQGTGTQPDSGVWYYKGCAWDQNLPATYGAMNWNSASSQWYYGDLSWGYSIGNGAMSNYANVWDILAWKAPATATAAVDLTGSIITADWAAANLYLEVLNNAGTSLQSLTVSRSTGTFAIHLSDLSVNAGDYVYIRTKVTDGSNWQYTVFDTLTITTSSVPEPASLALLALGGLLAVARPRKR